MVATEEDVASPSYVDVIVRNIFGSFSGKPDKCHLKACNAEIPVRGMACTHIGATLRMIFYQLACRIPQAHAYINIKASVYSPGMPVANSGSIGKIGGLPSYVSMEV